MSAFGAFSVASQAREVQNGITLVLFVCLYYYVFSPHRRELCWWCFRPTGEPDMLVSTSVLVIFTKEGTYFGHRHRRGAKKYKREQTAARAPSMRQVCAVKAPCMSPVRAVRAPCECVMCFFAPPAKIRVILNSV